MVVVVVWWLWLCDGFGCVMGVDTRSGVDTYDHEESINPNSIFMYKISMMTEATSVATFDQFSLFSGYSRNTELNFEH